MQMWVRFSSLLLVMISIVETSFVKLDQNGYENVLIRIADDVSSVDCLQTISNLKIMMQEASSAVCAAVEGRAYFRNVTILIPNHWAVDGNCWPLDANNNNIITWPRTHLADLIVTPNHPNFGSQPFTLNYGGCGVGSLPIRLPFGYLTTPGKGVAIAHEWFHYRYGVFDEIGVNGDPLYPEGYRITQPEAEIWPTSCTNEQLKGEWIGSEWQNSHDNGNITSSIMFSTDLPSIHRLCTADNHLKAPPTKHNWLCGSRSVSEVIYSHHDFVDNNNTQAKNCSQITIFSVATNRHRGYHIVLDVTSAMGVDDLMESAVFAASHFVWFLPDGAIVSIDTFGETYSQLQTPVALNLTNRNAILSRLDKVTIKSTGNTAGLSLALDNAMRMFRDGSEIILMTAAQEVPSNFSVYVDQFRRHLIAPHIVALSIRASDLLTPLARDGRLYFVPTRMSTITPIVPAAPYRNAQTWMTDTLQSVYSRTRSYRAKVEERTLQLTDGWTNNGTFQLESTATSLVFAFYHLDDGFSMTFTQGILLSPSNERCPIVRLSTLALYTANCGNILLEKGTWSYYIDVSGSSTVRLDTFFSSDDSVSPVRVETWTNSIENQQVDWRSQRVVIYALATQQEKAVSGLNLVAHISGDSEADPTIFSVSLNENNPSDVTKGDGVYSAQLTHLPRNSIRFSYVVEIVAGGVGTVDSGAYNGHPMAGSFIPSGQPVPLSSAINRYVYGGSFQLSLPYDGRDVLPPGRIADLNVVVLSASDSKNSSAQLSWTAPRDDYNMSAILVDRFVITSEDSDSKEEAILFNGMIKPLSGTVDHVIMAVDVPKSNRSRTVYFRVYGLDSSGNQAQPSNIAAVYAPASYFPSIDPTGDAPVLPAWLFWFLIGLAVACAILMAAIIAACVRRYRDAQKREAMGADWVQIGETSIETNSRLPERKQKEANISKAIEPQVPDFNAHFTPSPGRRASSVSSSTRWSDNSYQTTGSEIYHRPARVTFTEARIERPADSPERPYSSSKSLPTYAFGGNWDNAPSPASSSSISITTASSSSPSKKVPPPPPLRKYHPYSFERNDNNGMRNQARKAKVRQLDETNDDAPLASSPSYLARQLKKQDVSYLQRGELPKTYSMQTLTSASNSSLSRFGVVLGADSEASLV